MEKEPAQFYDVFEHFSRTYVLNDANCGLYVNLQTFGIFVNVILFFDKKYHFKQKLLLWPQSLPVRPL